MSYKFYILNKKKHSIRSKEIENTNSITDLHSPSSQPCRVQPHRHFLIQSPYQEYWFVWDLLPTLNLVASDVPKNLIHLLSPLDLTVNRTLKRIEQDASAEYISAEITRCLNISPRIDDIKVNTGKAVLRNLHAKTISKAYTYFKTPEWKRNILQGWSAAGISKAVKRMCDTLNIRDTDGLVDPFSCLTLNN